MAWLNRRTFLQTNAALVASAMAGKAAGAEDAGSGKVQCDNREIAEKPNPIITGPSQAQGIARFASRARYEDLTAERRERLKVDVLDSLACSIGALGAPPIEAYLAQAEEFGGSGPRCTLIGGGQANVVYAAAYNTALIRYLDFMDSYLAGAELCHPSDNLGAVLAATEHAGGSGKDFLTSLAVAYQVEAALTAAAPFMARGFDLTTQLTYSLGAGLSKALGLDEKRAAWAVEICGATGIPLLVVRTTPISEWKGLAPSQLALGCVHGTLLASRGVSGPAYVIEGADGLAHALGRAVRVDWEAERLDCFDRLALKSYNSAVPTQSAIFCMLELQKARPFDPNDVASIAGEVFQDAYDFTGGGKFGPKTNVHTKEDADHSLPYLLSVAALDGDVQPAQLDPRRIAKPDVQGLLKKVEIRPDSGFTARYPGEMPSRVIVRLKSGESYSHEVNGYPGFPTRPLTWDEITAKFERLVGGRADKSLCADIQAAVRSLESIQVAELMKLVGQVRRS
jgi:2-methylcitrate dehydratase